MDTSPTPKRKPGRPRVAKPKDGNPTLQIRLKPEELAWVRSRGGATWVRGLIHQQMP